MKFSSYNLLVPNSHDNNHYLFNTLNGNCVEIDANTSNAIRRNDISQLSNDVQDLFIKLGILIQDFVDEHKIISYFHDQGKFASNFFSSTVLLTWACNLKCVYCFENTGEHITNMNIEQANRYIQFVINAAKEKNVKTVSICLFGGEPLVNFEIGEYILDKVKTYCDNNGVCFVCSIITNGTLINENIIDRLIKYSCYSIQITLDGVKQVHDSRRMKKNGDGSFDEIISALKLLNSRYKEIRTVIRINIDKSNKDDTHQLLNYIGKEGLDLTNCHIDFGIVRGLANACAAYSSHCLMEDEIGPALFELWNYAEAQGFKYNIRPLRKWMYCGLYGDNQFTITPDCDVYKCWEHTGQKEHLMGTLDSDGNMRNIQYAFYDWMAHDPLKNEECKKCIYLPCCGGGCAVASYHQNKTYHSTGCFKVKGVIEKQVLKYVESIEKSLG